MREETKVELVAKKEPESNVRSVLNERGQTYGAFKDNAKIAQQLKTIWWESPGCKRLEESPAKDSVNEGMEMILHKIARMCNGDATFIDSIKDIIGYGTLITDVLSKTEGSSDAFVIKKRLTNGVWTEVGKP